MRVVGVRRFALEVQQINEPIFDTPLFLQSIGGSAARATGLGGASYPQFAATGALSLGPQIGKAPPAVEFDGSLTLALSTPWRWSASGVAKVDGFELAHGELTYTSGGLVSLTGSVEVSIRGYGLAAAITSQTFFEAAGNYNINATGQVKLGAFGTLTGQVVFSNKGFAACAPVTFGGSTFAIGWGVLADGTQQVLHDSCDLGAYTTTAAAAAVVPAGQPITVPGHRPGKLEVIAVQGGSAPPAVSVTAPGLSLAARAGASVRDDLGAIVPDSGTDVTYVLLGGAGAARYTLTSSNTTITSVHQAMSLPRVAVHGTIRLLSRGRRQLIFRQTPAPGQRLMIYEVGGGMADLLATSAHATGRIAYVPKAGLSAKRTLVGVTVGPSAQPARRPYSPATGSRTRPRRRSAQLRCAGDGSHGSAKRAQRATSWPLRWRTARPTP